MARINHDFAKSRSSIGGIFVNRNSIGLSNDYNRVVAFDGRLGFGKKAQLTGYLSKSTTPGLEGRDHAMNLTGVYNWDGWILRASYTEVGENKLVVSNDEVLAIISLYWFSQ